MPALILTGQLLKRSGILIIWSAVASICCGLDPFKNENIEKIGMLQVIEPDCATSEGCGPKYTLWGEELYDYLPLRGNVNDDYHQLIVKVTGEKTILPSCEYNSLDYTGPTDALFVEACFALSRIKYHSFLLQKAEEYYIAKYGEHKGWNKTFSWEMIENAPIIKVRMTQDDGSYIELWYNGVTGEFIKEINTVD